MTLPAAQYDPQQRRMTLCQADDDGDCTFAECPQKRDDEPARTNRHCPFDLQADDITDLERTVLVRVANGEDPWRGRLGGSRRVSQALGRLRRKGLVALPADGPARMTEPGVAILRLPREDR